MENLEQRIEEAKVACACLQIITGFDMKATFAEGHKALDQDVAEFAEGWE